MKCKFCDKELNMKVVGAGASSDGETPPTQDVESVSLICPDCITGIAKLIKAIRKMRDNAQEVIDVVELAKILMY